MNMNSVPNLFGSPEITTPSLLPHKQDKSDMLSNYRVRVMRFSIDGESGDTPQLEELFTKGMDPSNDNVYIIENKTFTYEDRMMYIVTYYEKKVSETTVVEATKEDEVLL